jgi:hypothetical protein
MRPLLLIARKWTSRLLALVLFVQPGFAQQDGGAPARPGCGKDIVKVLGKLEGRTASAQPSSANNILDGFPPDLREKYINALNGAVSTRTDIPAEHYGEGLVDQLRAAGIPEQEIVARVRAKLEAVFASGPARRELPSNDLKAGLPVAYRSRKFLESHDLTPYRQMRKQMESSEDDDDDLIHFRVSVKFAYGMALSIHAPDLAMRALEYMVQLRDYDDAMFIAEEHHDSRALMTLGHLALVDFYDGGGSDPHSLHAAIESFKRVQGPLKLEANRVLTDLALDVTSPEVLASLNSIHSKQTFVRAGLKALRSTGEFVRKTPNFISGSFYDFVTTVKDPQVVKAIRRLLPEYIPETSRAGREDPPDYEVDVIEAEAAIGDVRGLNARADAKLADASGQRNQPKANPQQTIIKYKKAILYYELAGNREGVAKALDALYSEPAAFSRDVKITYKLVPVILRNQGTEGLPALQDYLKKWLAKNGSGGYTGQDIARFQKKLDDAVRTQNFNDFEDDAPDPRFPTPQITIAPQHVETVFEELVREEKTTREILEKALQTTTEAEKKRHRAQAVASLKMRQYQNAANEFREALDADGIVEVADAMVAHQDFVNATTWYLNAAVLRELQKGR